jgi:uncharacterized membrane protein
LTYNANGGIGSQVDALSPYLPGSAVIVLGPGSITRAGFTFLGWSYLSDGVVVYRPGASFVIDRNTTLYAVWGEGNLVPGPVPPGPVPPGSTSPEPTPPTLDNRPSEDEPSADSGAGKTSLGSLIADILAGRVPTGSFEIDNVWSLLNLLMSVLAVLIAFVLLVTLFFRRRDADDETEEEKQWRRSRAAELVARREARAVEMINTGMPPAAAAEQAAREIGVEEEYSEPARVRRRWLKIIAILLGVIPLILFLILEDITLPVVWVDHWTPLIGAFFCAHLIFVLIQLFAKKKIDPDEEAPASGESLQQGSLA